MSKPPSADFFKFLLPRHLTSQSLLIPPDYVKHFSTTLQERIILKDVSGKVWNVGVERTQEGVFIKNGWQNFVKDHNLKVGEVLVFKYQETYSFLVKIFGVNGCKKVDLPGKIKEETELDNQTTVKHAYVKKGDLGTEYSSGVEENGSKQLNYKLQKNCKSFEKINTVDPECAQFTLTYKKLSPYRMWIPTEVNNREDFHFEPEMILRNEKGEEWPVQICEAKAGGRSFGIGWKKYCEDNNIGFGERCMFKFNTNRTSNTIDVEVLDKKPDAAQIQ